MCDYEVARLEKGLILKDHCQENPMKKALYISHIYENV